MAFFPYVMTCVRRHRSAFAVVEYLENGLTYRIPKFYTDIRINPLYSHVISGLVVEWIGVDDVHIKFVDSRSNLS